MKVFLSWSGERGRCVAEAIMAWLPRALPGAEPWMSTQIPRGTMWSAELLREIELADAAILCATADGLNSTWLAFESGILSGAEFDDRRVACLAFDVSPELLSDTPLGLFPAFVPDEDGMLGLVRHLRASAAKADGVHLTAERPHLEALLRKIPVAHTRAFELIVCVPEAMRPIKIDPMPDRPWTDFLGLVEQGMSTAMGVEKRVDLGSARYFDLAAENWVPRPALLSSVTTTRLAVLDPAVIENWGDSPAAISWVLRERLDVMPRRMAARQSLERDIADLAARQETHRNAKGQYSASLDGLGFLPSPGSTLTLAGATSDGWAAIVSRDEWPGYLAYRVGDGAGIFPAAPTGELFPVEARRARPEDLSPPPDPGPPPDRGRGRAKKTRSAKRARRP